MNPAIEKLEQYLVELKAMSGFASLEAKAEHIGLMNQIDTAIGNLKLCDRYGIFPGSLVSVLPETENQHCCYLVVHEDESSSPENWEAVKFDGRQIQFNGGDLVIRR